MDTSVKENKRRQCDDCEFQINQQYIADDDERKSSDLEHQIQAEDESWNGVYCLGCDKFKRMVIAGKENSEDNQRPEATT